MSIVEHADAGVLSHGEVASIRRLAEEYHDLRAASIEALKLVQREHRWISDDRLRAIAAVLGMSTDELEGVATFYNLIFRRPVGRHVIMLCDSVSCWIMGGERVRDRLCSTLGTPLGGTTADERFTLLPIVCLGACDHAPTMMIDGKLHEDLDEQRIEEVLAEYK